ncbi:MAG: nitronate monooxygenase family protein, partial [Lachnospiraceae bacterium]|nr:nitronate monooxygenase family protein [Lachnospiraceae bacterium]
MFRSLKIGDKIARLPIIQGGMGVGVSLSGLAGAVAKAGGVGIISTAQIGYREDDYEKNPLTANLRAIGKEISRARELASGGLIGVNIMVATKCYEQYVKAAAEAGADVIISGAGLPMDLPGMVEGYNTCIAPIVSSVKALSLICRRWLKKYNRLPDLVVIEGPKAGGHLGFKQEEAMNLTVEEYLTEIKAIIAQVRSYEKQYEKQIPVAVAGGICEKADADRYFEAGADAVQVASRFVTTYECDAHENFKKCYLDAKKEDIVIVKSPVGMPGRAICNPFIKASQAGETTALGRCYQCLQKCNRPDIPYCISKALTASVKGDTDHGLVFCGANAYKQNKMQHVSEVIEELLPEK